MEGIDEGLGCPCFVQGHLERNESVANL